VKGVLLEVADPSVHRDSRSPPCSQVDDGFAVCMPTASAEDRAILAILRLTCKLS